jgi:hypothetical protein
VFDRVCVIEIDNETVEMRVGACMWMCKSATVSVYQSVIFCSGWVPIQNRKCVKERESVYV